ncbi:hypothetical protein [Nocardioides sp.]|uniref:hypothetical protein n=1 Tax=Nocardioides sp. TaxID=35761 RepID=UPI002ECFF2BE
MTEQPDFKRLPDEIPLDQTVEIEVEDVNRYAGAGGGGDLGGGLGVADCDGD